MALYSCLHEFGHGLYEAQMDPRHYRTTLRGRRPGSASTSPRAGCGRTSSAAPAVLRVGLAAACGDAPGGRSRRIDAGRALPRRQPGSGSA